MAGTSFLKLVLVKTVFEESTSDEAEDWFYIQRKKKDEKKFPKLPNGFLMLINSDSDRTRRLTNSKVSSILIASSFSIKRVSGFSKLNHLLNIYPPRFNQIDFRERLFSFVSVNSQIIYCEELRAPQLFRRGIYPALLIVRKVRFQKEI